jgi:hypothetical protein
MEWKHVLSLLEEVKVKAVGENELVDTSSIPPNFICVGKGTDAAVFVHSAYPSYAFKVYADGKEEKRKNEEKAYRVLQRNPYFPRFYGSEGRYLVMSYEQGVNLYECLTKGIEIPPTIIEKVDTAIAYARSVGLNPRDIHLKNIILQEDTVKLIDVSEYVKSGNDKRWEHLKEGYRLYYPLLASRKIPPSLIEFVKKQYKKHKQIGFSVKTFGGMLLPLFLRKKKEISF